MKKIMMMVLMMYLFFPITFSQSTCREVKSSLGNDVNIILHTILSSVPDFISDNYIYSHGNKDLYKTNLTTLECESFTLPIQNTILFVEQGFNGEYVVFERSIIDVASDAPSPNDKLGGIWISSGGLGGTWTKVLTYKNRYIWPERKWSFAKTNNAYLFSEYGNSTATQSDSEGLVGRKGRATCAYVSDTSGKEWRKILDLEELPIIFPPSLKGWAHIHAISWDTDYNRIWVSTGDGSGNKIASNKNILWTDNMGEDWKNINLSLYFGEGSNDPYHNIQFLDIYADQDMVLAFSDCWRQGVYRMQKISKEDIPVIEHVYALPIQDDITHFSNGFYRANAEQPILIATKTGDAATIEGKKARNFLLIGTMDGIHYSNIINIPNPEQIPFFSFTSYAGNDEYWWVLAKAPYGSNTEIYKFMLSDIAVINKEIMDDVVCDIYINQPSNILFVKNEDIDMVELFTIEGRLLQTKRCLDTCNQIEVDISKYAKGNYIVRVSSKKRMQAVKLVSKN